MLQSFGRIHIGADVLGADQDNCGLSRRELWMEIIPDILARLGETLLTSVAS